MQPRQGLFDQHVGLGRVRAGAQVIAEEQRIALVATPGDAHVHIGRARSVRRVYPAAFQRLFHPRAERAHADLDANAVFGSQARHGSGADVVDPLGQAAQGLAQPGGDRLKFGRLILLVWNDLDFHGLLSFSARLFSNLTEVHPRRDRA